MTESTEPEQMFTAQQVAELLASLKVGAQAETPTPTVLIAEAIKEYLATRQSDGTRRGYRTHLHRYRDGIEPICDMLCEPCLKPHDGVFKCNCDCRRCVGSRVSLPPQGTLYVSAETMSVRSATIVATAARRIALKSGEIRGRNRAANGLSVRPADGRGAEEMAVAAMRSFFASHERPLKTKGAGALQKPSRKPSSRRALTQVQLNELCLTTETTGNDPDLDALILEFAIATGARRSGVYGLTVKQVLPHEQLIRLKDKGDRDVDMPVSSELIERLMTHCLERGGPRCDPSQRLLHQPGASVFWSWAPKLQAYVPLTSRRFDNIIGRWHLSHGWAERQQVGFHYLRHTVAHRLKAGWGQHVAQRYLRHADGNVTDSYGRCTIEELAEVMGDLLGFEHPLVATEERVQRAYEHRYLGEDHQTSL
jgi:integrase